MYSASQQGVNRLVKGAGTPGSSGVRTTVGEAIVRSTEVDIDGVALSTGEYVRLRYLSIGTRNVLHAWPASNRETSKKRKVTTPCINLKSFVPAYSSDLGCLSLRVV